MNNVINYFFDIAEIRTVDLIHDLSHFDDDLDCSTTVADHVVQVNKINLMSFE